MLDAARLDRDALQLAPRDFDLREVIGEVAGAWRAAAASKALAFDVSIAADVPRAVHLDPVRLKQILVNLLSNACKYTDTGSVSLGVDLDDGALRCVVADTGVGIGAAQRQRLFEPYAAGADAPADASSGLGLSICRRLTALMNGAIEIDSEPGHGTRVVVRVPLVAPAAGTATAATVLVCDDDGISRMLLSALLDRAGYAVVEVDDGSAALARWRARDIGALITDLHMPGLGGSELVRRLRAEEAGVGHTPVIVCSGSSVYGDPPAALDVDAHLVKPVDASLLVWTLQRLGVRAAAPAADG